MPTILHVPTYHYGLLLAKKKAIRLQVFIYLFLTFTVSKFGLIVSHCY